MTTTQKTIIPPEVRAGWTTVRPGVERRLLRTHEDAGATYVLRFAAGARFPLHTHPRGEELFVLSGHVLVGARQLVANDYLWTAPGGMNAVEALAASELLVVAPGGVVLGATGAGEGGR